MLKILPKHLKSKSSKSVREFTKNCPKMRHKYAQKTWSISFKNILKNFQNGNTLKKRVQKHS